MNRKKKQSNSNSITFKLELNESTTENISQSSNFLIIMREKVIYIQEIIQKTIISVSKYQKIEIFSNSDYINCISILNELYEKTATILDKITVNESSDLFEQIISELQPIVDKISTLVANYGTSSIVDLIFICFGTKYLNEPLNNDVLLDKYTIIKRFVHPIGYKTISWKPNHDLNNVQEHNKNKYCNNKITEISIQQENCNHLECIEGEIYRTFHTRINGIRIIIQNPGLKKTLIIHGIIEDLSLDCISNKYIIIRRKEISDEISKYSQTDKELTNRIMDTFTIKDILIAGNQDIYKKSIIVMNEVNNIKLSKLDDIVSRFVELDMFAQRNLLIQLLLYNSDEIHYMAYLLYDIIATHNTTESIDSTEQKMIYDSFPWKIKLLFKDAMKNTIKYTQEITTKFDMNRISLEQQVLLMKAPALIKEKAINKLKEIKGKNDDSGSKAKQYLEGLLKIPFDVYREEPILTTISSINTKFLAILPKIQHLYSKTKYSVSEFPLKTKYSNQEIMQYINHFEVCLITNIVSWITDIIQNKCSLRKINEILRLLKIHPHMSKSDKVEYVVDYLHKNNECLDKNIIIFDSFEILDVPYNVSTIYQECNSIKTLINAISSQLNSITTVLDESIYGHDYAKSQILKIVGQWMNGKQSGYCFGFEGSPGIGKTSLAKKGLANCLVNEKGATRPFSFIALGGSCNGSTLEGHSYTYVNSTWGKIVDILMDSKCMNPIIYIDELDKVSATEHGKEIIGILTHLIDYTQNDGFQDRYYSGIPIDLSKALIIFSYNDVDKIDNILLDRIHRIKFDNLTTDDKIVIVQEYILPEINTKMGFNDTVFLDKDTIIYIIDTYTLEPGVRKLKELIFDLYGDINLELMKCTNGHVNTVFPIHITIQTIQDRYLKKYIKVSDKKIHTEDSIGVINGLWANTLGKGGIIPIETVFFPTSTFLELRLTGMQGDVMKESMNVAKSLAWGLTPHSVQKEWIETMKETQNQGIHIHCPDGAVSKDGPSAGTAITIAIYSLFNNRKIDHTVGITGEIDLKGNVTAIGGLYCKILGGIQAGIKTFIYPKSNAQDFVDFQEKYIDKNPDKYTGITYIPVSHINDVLDIIFT